MKFPNQSPYSYLFNNPLSYKDPTGLAPEKEKDGRNQIQQTLTIILLQAAFEEGVEVCNQAKWSDYFDSMQRLNVFKNAAYLFFNNWIGNAWDPSGGGHGDGSGSGTGGDGSIGRLGNTGSENGVGIHSDSNSDNKQPIPGILARIDGSIWAIPKSELIGISSYTIDDDGVYNIEDENYQLPIDNSFLVPDDEAMFSILDNIYDDMSTSLNLEQGGVINNKGKFINGGIGNECDANDPINKVRSAGDTWIIHDHKHSLSFWRDNTCGAFYPSGGDFNTAKNPFTNGIIVGRGFGRESFLFYNSSGFVLSIPNNYWINRRKK